MAELARDVPGEAEAPRSRRGQAVRSEPGPPRRLRHPWIPAEKLLPAGSRVAESAPRELGGPAVTDLDEAALAVLFEE